MVKFSIDGTVYVILINVGDNTEGWRHRNGDPIYLAANDIMQDVELKACIRYDTKMRMFNVYDQSFKELANPQITEAGEVHGELDGVSYLYANTPLPVLPKKEDHAPEVAENEMEKEEVPELEPVMEEEVTAEPVMEEPEPEHKVEEETTQPAESVPDDFMNPPEDAPVQEDAGQYLKTATVQLGTSKKRTPTVLVVGNGRPHGSGASFGRLIQDFKEDKVVVKDADYIPLPTRPSEVTPESLERAWSVTATNKLKFDSPEEQRDVMEAAKSTIDFEAVGIKEQAEEKVEEPEEDPEVRARNLAQGRKEFRAKIDPKIAQVIGDIPKALLGGIAEFTRNSIDTNLLNSQGYVYCIDHHWHKCGNWYCIDIVETCERYFYNQKYGASLPIPVATLKEWSALIGGDEV